MENDNSVNSQSSDPGDLPVAKKQQLAIDEYLADIGYKNIPNKVSWRFGQDSYYSKLIYFSFLPNTFCREISLVNYIIATLNFRVSYRDIIPTHFHGGIG